MIFAQFDPDAVINFAAETHVDRSIGGPGIFVQTNIVGTYTLLEAARCHFTSMSRTCQSCRGYTTYPPMKCLAPSETLVCSPRSRHMHQTPPIPPAKLIGHVGPRMASDVRSASDCQQLLQQLRSYQFPEKLIPVAIRCIGGALHSGLWRGNQRTRLAVCR